MCPLLPAQNNAPSRSVPNENMDVPFWNNRLYSLGRTAASNTPARPWCRTATVPCTRLPVFPPHPHRWPVHQHSGGKPKGEVRKSPPSPLPCPEDQHSRPGRMHSVASMAPRNERIRAPCLIAYSYCLWLDRSNKSRSSAAAFRPNRRSSNSLGAGSPKRLNSARRRQIARCHRRSPVRWQTDNETVRHDAFAPCLRPVFMFLSPRSTIELADVFRPMRGHAQPSIPLVE
jgi:hypothetical protein